MKVYRIKFGESGDSGHYSDDCKIAADNLGDALFKAEELSKQHIKDSDEAFEFDKKSQESEDAQQKQWHLEAKETWEVTSIIFEAELAA